jgi:hypothetical protein
MKRGSGGAGRKRIRLWSVISLSAHLFCKIK